MKNKSKLLALLLAVCMCVGLLAGCGDNAASAGSNAPASAPEAAAGSDAAEGVETSASNDGTLVAAATGFESKFSPFFAASADDQRVTDMTQVYLLTVDRVSNPVLQGIEGETRSYNGTDYTYTGVFRHRLIIRERRRHRRTTTSRMRDDIVSSPTAPPMTIDDVIFSMYVSEQTPPMTAAATFYSVPHRGHGGVPLRHGHPAAEPHAWPRPARTTPTSPTGPRSSRRPSGTPAGTRRREVCSGDRRLRCFTRPATAAMPSPLPCPLPTLRPSGASTLAADATATDFFQAIGDKYGCELLRRRHGSSRPPAPLMSDLILAEDGDIDRPSTSRVSTPASSADLTSPAFSQDRRLQHDASWHTEVRRYR